MTENLQDRRILIVEDEFILVMALRGDLEAQGAVVLGPCGSVRDAIAFIEKESDIHAAVLDVNLRGEEVFPAADLLMTRGVPMILTTGYDADSIPERFHSVARCAKPVIGHELIDTLDGLLANPENPALAPRGLE